MTIQISFDKRFFSRFDKSDEVFKEYLFIEINERRKPNVDQ